MAWVLPRRLKLTRYAGGNMVCGERVLWIQFCVHLHKMHLAVLERCAKLPAEQRRHDYTIAWCHGHFLGAVHALPLYTCANTLSMLSSHEAILLTERYSTDPKNLNWYFVAKSCMVGPACFAVLIWAIVLNGGSVGPSFQTSPKLSDPVYYGWLWMSALNSGFGGCSALIVAQADIARWARKPSDQTWSQLITYPVFSALPALFGILVASATSNVWGKQYWNLWDVLSAALDHYEMSPASRGLVFLASFSFAIAILGTNVAANSLPFGSDIAGLLPRWITIRRGQVLCSLLVFPIVPWKIISSAKSLLTFLSGYSILMGPFASICIVDYFFVRKGNLNIAHLYIGNADSQYWYTKGWNIRMIVAWTLGIVLPFPGFIDSFGTTLIGDGARHMWNLGYLLSIAVSGVVYYALFLVFPDPHIDKLLAFEQQAPQHDGLIDGEAVQSQAGRDNVSEVEKGTLDPEVKKFR